MFSDRLSETQQANRFNLFILTKKKPVYDNNMQNK